MFEWISQHLVITGSCAAVIGGFILKKTGVLKWIREKASEIGESVGKIGYNIGVTITTKGNQLPGIGIFWENAIEPVLAMIFEVIPGIVFNFFSNVTEGMKSDNKELKK